ncbi:conserved protein, unknown function [Hepatocystis sp. ex Piliocolobus tephrosceles]|nr:conserved protein, unknown function [Hepatocystis sp. ex Piliocolobus tephrosceles]
MNKLYSLIFTIIKLLIIVHYVTCVGSNILKTNQNIYKGQKQDIQVLSYNNMLYNYHTKPKLYNKINKKKNLLYLKGYVLGSTNIYKNLPLNIRFLINHSHLLYTKKCSNNSQKIQPLYEQENKINKTVKNLKQIKKIDHTILGKQFNDKEEEVIKELPTKFLNTIKWALEYQLRNFNCKFKRTQKLAKANNEQLKSLDNYTIGYKEKLLAMLQNDKNFFLNIINKLKAKDFFNFDIYSIFKFVNIDIRFLFFPDSHEKSAVFFLIFGNLKHAIDYYIKMKHTVDFKQFLKNENNDLCEDGTFRMSIKARKRLLRAEKKQLKAEKRKAYIAGQSDTNVNHDGVRQSDETIIQHHININHDDVVTSQNDTHIRETSQETIHTITKKTDKEIDISSSLENKFNYMINNYDKIEYFFINHFKTTDALKTFFDKCHIDENKKTKEEITFNLNGEKTVTTKEIITNGLNLDMIKKIIMTSPRLSLIKKKTLLKRIAHYKNKLNYSYNELINILYTTPSFFNFGNLKKKYNEILYIHETIKEEDLNKFIKKYPKIFTYNIYRTIRPKLLYLIRHLNKTFTHIISFPQYFSYSFRLRIIPRHIAYMSLFYDNYINYYNELLKKYTYNDFNNKFNTLVYTQRNLPSIDLKKLLQTSDEMFMKYYKIPYDKFVECTQMAKHIKNPFLIV